MSIGKFDIAFILSALSLIVVFAITGLTELHWFAHAIAGIISFLFSVAIATVGATLKGRIKSKGTNLFNLHKKLSIYLTILVLSAFFSGLWDRYHWHPEPEPFFWQHVTPLATVVQGWFGLVVTILAIAQVTPCFVGKRKNRKLHMILGYILVIALAIQIFLGVEAALVEITGG